MPGIKRHALMLLLAAIAFPISLLSQSIDGLLRTGDEYYKNGDFNKAAESWKRALDADPKNKEVKQKLEKLYSQKYANDKGDYEEKISDLSLKKKSIMAGRTKEVTIDWDAVDGASKYLVQIKDSSGKMLVDTSVTENRISFPVSPGNYTIRVGAYNIFEKIGAWSEWTELKVVTPELSEAYSFRGATDHGLMCAAGYLYSFVFSDYSDIYESSPRGWLIKLEYPLVKVIPVENIPVVKNIRLEVECAQRYFTGRSSLQNIDTSLELNSVLFNIGYVSDFNFPVNYAIRFGGGVVRSIQSAKVEDPAIELSVASEITSTDPCYQFTASVIMDIGIPLFIEAGAGIFWVDYIGIDMKSISLFCLAGIHI